MLTETNSEKPKRILIDLEEKTVYFENRAMRVFEKIELSPTTPDEHLLELAYIKIGAKKFGIESLSTREQEVAILVSHGLSNKEIAKALILSPRTIQVHIANIFGKLNVRSRSSIASKISKLAELSTSQEFI